MKNLRVAFSGTLTAAILLSALLFAGCDNPLNRPETGGDASAPGTVRLRLAVQTPRTLVPDTDKTLAYKVSAQLDETIQTVDESWNGAGTKTIALEQGIWTITVTGFFTEGETRVDVSRGQAEVTITANEATEPVIINLTPLGVSEGAGALKYGELDFESLNITSATLTLTSATNSSTAPIEADLLAADYGADSVIADVPVGYWWLTVKLGNANGYAIKSELVHIYKDRTANITDSAVFTFSADDFSRLLTASFTVSAEGNDSTGTTKLILSFSPDIPGLAAEEIDITPAGYVITGALTAASTAGVYELAINDVVQSGGITLAINRTDYEIASRGVAVVKTYTVTYSAGEGSGTPPQFQMVAGGRSITLPGQGSMDAWGRVFEGWDESDGTFFSAGSSYTVNANVTFTARWRSNGASEGVYIGLISLAGNSSDLTGGAPILLNASGLSSLNYYLNNNYTIATQAGTALFYGVHQALANLKAHERDYPVNLDSVNVITFTDGLDNGSTGLAAFEPIEDQSPDTTAEYMRYVQNQITGRSIAGKSITAYSVGVMGNDVTDIPGFQNSLRQIASSQENTNELTDFSQVQDTFNSIAEGLNIVHTSTSFTVITTLLESGTIVRMTFDDITDAALSGKYIEGTVIRTGSGTSMTYTLTDINYAGGLSSSAETGPITGTRNGSEVNFVFNNITNYDPDVDKPYIRQWTKTSGAAGWQINSEYDVGDSVVPTVEKRSSIIYLVLDSSRSLEDSQISKIRSAVQSFIRSLYDQMNN